MSVSEIEITEKVRTEIIEMSHKFLENYFNLFSDTDRICELLDEIAIDSDLNKEIQIVSHFCFEILFDMSYDLNKIHEDSVISNLSYLLHQR